MARSDGAGSENVGSENVGSENAGSENAGSENAGSEYAGSEVADSSCSENSLDQELLAACSLIDLDQNPPSEEDLERMIAGHDRDLSKFRYYTQEQMKFLHAQAQLLRKMGREGQRAVEVVKNRVEMLEMRR